MKFRTTCTHCQSVFLLTAEQLEAAQGWAQCSICGGAFNARSRLASENGDPLPMETVAPQIVEPQTVVSPEPVTEIASDIPIEIPRAGTDEISDPTLMPETSATSPLAGVEARAAQPDLTSIILIDPDAEVTDDYGPLPVFSASSNIEGGTRDERSIYGPSYSAPVAVAKPVKQAFTPPPPYTNASKMLSRSKPARSRISKALWMLLILILVAILMLQLVYFLRDFIALKMPATRPWLEDACAGLGCTLSLPKDADLIQIIGSDLQAEPAGAGHLQLKLTLGNRAPYAQAWPVIVLTLTDAQDQPQARRSFAPSEYLADPKLLDAGIPAQSEHLLALPLAVRNLPMAGFHLEIAY